MTPTRKRKYEEVCWSLSRSSLTVCCAGVSAFCFPIVGVLSLVAISTTHCTVHMSSAWRRGSVGMCNVSVSCEWDGHDQPSQSSIYTAQVVLKCLSLTPGSHSVCAVRIPLGVDQKILSMKREPILSDFSQSKCLELLPHVARCETETLQYHLCIYRRL